MTLRSALARCVCITLVALTILALDSVGETLLAEAARSGAAPASYQVDPADATAFSVIRWMSNGIENAAVQVYLTREGDRTISAVLISNLLDRARDMLSSVVTVTDTKWKTEVGPNGVAYLRNGQGGCRPPLEDFGGYCIPSSTGRMQLPYFGFSPKEPVDRRASSPIQSTSVDPLAVTQFRWLGNAVESAAIQAYWTRKGDRRISAAVIRDVLFKVHDGVVEVASITDQDARTRLGDILKRAQPTGGCPGGWQPDQSNGFCTPCVWATVPCTTFGMPLKLMNVR